MPRVLRPGALEMLPWVPTVFGVGIMIGLLVFAVVSLRPIDSAGGEVPVSPQLTPPFLAGPSLPPQDGETTEAAPAAPRASVTPSPARTSATPRAPRTTTPPPPAPTATPDLTGRYRVVESFSDTFIGEVRVANSSGGSLNWTVRLRFPSNVGELRTFWVESGQQPKLQRSGDTLIFTSGAPVGPGKAALLRFQFDRTGAVSTPSACSVDGTTCTGI